MVMVHGGCHGAWQWANLQGWFAGRGWDSVAFDWFSHGKSRTLPPHEWVRREIISVREEIDIACDEAGARPVLMGHSMGGLASLNYAATTQRDLAAVVLLAPVVPRQYALNPIEIEVDPERPWNPPDPETARMLFYSGVDDETAAALYPKLQAESPAAVWQATRWTAEVNVATVRAPVLVVAAENDVLTPAEYVLALAEGLGAEHILLPGVGHGVTLDPGWPQLAERIDAWLSSVL
ncbi:pimeloyl-ACP methyl ester carboxylesterase [Amycolatopsis endophytica]|uniref:Pimeloyl-ACP methyl ester carboxylesterase n=1 Tax=Amycolatopsis endophytica TaxID=860233 RepID=A0A853BBA9_9PSEU|nr:alpha/beta fold hydrolase [Amycolatopsis endophytica]NYI91676.1 pimeloyl-ACP methyl ester carboxylesterase [Amycolatopsis endophytica]